MCRMSDKIHHLPNTEADAAGDAIHAIIGAFNTAQTGMPDTDAPLALVLRDDAGAITGGLYGRSYYDWLFVNLLIVPEALRGQRMGSKLMAEAETIARARGCTGIWLDTFSFQARGFYEKLGFTMFGEIEDYPEGHARYFFKKRL
jgi:GNAT superfamily N-acetyltransferase